MRQRGQKIGKKVTFNELAKHHIGERRNIPPIEREQVVSSELPRLLAGKL